MGIKRPRLISVLQILMLSTGIFLIAWMIWWQLNPSQPQVTGVTAVIELTTVLQTRPIILSVLLFLSVLGGLHYYEQMPKHLRWVFNILLIVVIAVGLYRVFNVVGWSWKYRYTWDFMHFWLNARAAVGGNNFYDPAQLYNVVTQAGETFRITYEDTAPFFERLVDSGFWYPPISILILLPLGLFDVQTAWIINYGLVAMMFFVATWLLWRTFLPESNLRGWGAVIGLMLSVYPTHQNFLDGQTNFLLLVLLLLFWRYRDRPQSGILLALAITVKPVAGGIVLFLLLQRHWRSLIYLIGTVIVLSLIVMLFWGTQTFFGYSPASIDPFVYREIINQGLIGTILRRVDYDVNSGGSPLLHPFFLASAAITTLITAWLTYRLPKDKDGLGICLTLTLGLLVYPTTLINYGSLLMLPLWYFWSKRAQLPFAPLGVIAAITVILSAMNLRDGILTFYAYLSCWGTAVLAGVYFLYGKPWLRQMDFVNRGRLNKIFG